MDLYHYCCTCTSTQEAINCLIILYYLTLFFLVFCFCDTFISVILISPLTGQAHLAIGVTLSNRLECLLSLDWMRNKFPSWLESSIYTWHLMGKILYLLWLHWMSSNEYDMHSLFFLRVLCSSQLWIWQQCTLLSCLPCICQILFWCKINMKLNMPHVRGLHF